MRTYTLTTPPEPKFGLNQRLVSCPVVNVPDGSVVVRRRIRVDRLPEVFVREPDGSLVKWLAGPDGPNALKLLWPVAANRKEKGCVI